MSITVNMRMNWNVVSYEKDNRRIERISGVELKAEAKFLSIV